jgi:hypothetical protein
MAFSIVLGCIQDSARVVHDAEDGVSGGDGVTTADIVEVLLDSVDDPLGDEDGEVADDSAADADGDDGALGRLCDDDTPCVEGICVEGFCCDSACDGVCEACVGGRCRPIKEGTDPRDECDPSEPAS